MPAFFRRPAVLLLLGLCAIGLVVSLAGRLVSGPAGEPKRVDLASGAANQACPSFSPDGRRLAFSAKGASAQEPFHVFVRELPSGAPRQLTQADADDIGPAWSPDGATLAFVRVKEGHGRIMAMPAAGGAERQIAEFTARQDNNSRPAASLAWTPDGRSLVAVQSNADQPAFLVLLSVSNGASRRLTDPPAKTRGDSQPAVAPDGKTLAFVRSGDEEGSDIWLCDLSGQNLRRLTFDGRTIRGITWTEDGKDLVYSADRVGLRLWRISAYGGNSREVIGSGKDASSPAIAPKGHRLVFIQTPTVTTIWRGDLTASGPEAAGSPYIRGSGHERRPAWSPDGKKIADVSDESGPDEVYVQNADGTDRVQLTELNAHRIGQPRWSPDSRSLVFAAWPEDTPAVYVVPADHSSGPAHLRLPPGSHAPSWSHDGKSIYFANEGLIWKADKDGSHPQQLTRRGGSGEPEESADGKTVYYRNWRSIWRVPANGGEEEELVTPNNESWWISLEATPKGLYYVEYNPGQQVDVLVFYDFRTQKPARAFELKDLGVTPGSTYSISPDGRYILYPKTDRSAANLVMMEDFL